MSDRLDLIEKNIEKLMDINRLILMKIDDVLMPDKGKQISYVVAEMQKGNKEPWNQLQAANKIKYGIKRKRKGVNK